MDNTQKELSQIKAYIVLRGILLVLVALLFIFFPTTSIEIAILIIGSFIILDGIISGIGGFFYDIPGAAKILNLIFSVVSVILGIIVIANPGLTAITLLYFFAAWAIISGVFSILTTFFVKEGFKRESLTILGGLISIVLGVVLFYRPLGGIFAISYLMGFYLLFVGITYIAAPFFHRAEENNLAA